MGSRLFLPVIAVFFFVASVADETSTSRDETDSANWLSYGKGNSNQRYSRLAQIDRGNVDRLRPAWIYQTGVLGSFPTNPLIVDGVMYITTPYNHVVALDAATGVERWKYKHEQSQERLCCGSHNRGLAWAEGRLFMITADARIMALDSATGKVVWDVPIVDPMTGDPKDLDDIKVYDESTRAKFDKYTRFAGNMAPLVYDGRVYVGVSGTGYTAVLEDAEGDGVSLLSRPGVRKGLRAFLTAYDAETGNLDWRWYVTASSSWEGDYAEHTQFGDFLGRNVAREKKHAPQHKDSWLRGGGSLYSSPSVDPDLGLIFVGTGNPSPGYAEQQRPGDNLYTSSVVALEADTGRIRWYQQIIPHDIWGYDVAAPPLLLELAGSNGNPTPAVAVAAKTGWVYFFDRKNGQPIRRSEPFVPQSRTMFSWPTEKGVEIAPGAAGGANWPPMSFSQSAGLLFVAGSHNPTSYKLERDANGQTLMTMGNLNNPTRWGTVTAIEPQNGKIRWQQRTDLPVVSGALSTAGGLLFHGQSNRFFVARDVSTGQKLWEFQTGAGVNAPPVTYTVNGRQYVAVASGGHALFKYPLGNAVVAFELP